MQGADDSRACRVLTRHEEQHGVVVEEYAVLRLVQRLHSTQVDLFLLFVCTPQITSRHTFTYDDDDGSYFLLLVWQVA